MSSHFLQQCCAFFHFWGGNLFYAVPICSNSSSMFEYVVVEYQNREHSTAQHSTAQSPLHKTANQVRADQSTCQKRHVRTCMLRSFCFLGACSSWHLQVACLHPKCWTIYYICHHSNPFFLATACSGRSTRSALYEPTCTVCEVHWRCTAAAVAVVLLQYCAGAL